MCVGVLGSIWAVAFFLHSYALTCKSLYMLHIEFYNVVQVYSILIKLINGGNLYKSC